MTILIAEDERITRQRLRRQLQSWGYSVVATEDGAQAWDQFQQQQFDIVVTDWDMPEMDGYELTRRIRAVDSTRYTYLIMLTGRTDKADLVAGIEAGADDFLSKPFDRNELRARLRAGERIIRLEQSLASQNQELADYSQQLERTLGELEESQTALVQAEKMGSLGRLVAGVAHEINTPLGALRSGIDTMQRIAVKLDERFRNEPGEADKKVTMLLTSLVSLTRQSSHGCERIDGIVTNLRHFAQLDRADYQRVNIHAGLENTLHLLRHEFGDEAVVSRDFGETPDIDCAPRDLNQLFMNLLLNAKEAIKKSGRPGAIRIRTWTEDDQVWVEISDNGCGIPEEQLERIFDPGFTTKGVQVGTGLGLPICYKIAEAHGGSIDVTSEIGEGATFVLSLPVDAVS